MGEEAGSNGNGRIMVAQADIQNLSERLAEFTAEVRAWMRESDQRNLANSIQISAMSTQLDTLRAEVDRLRVKSERWDAINSIGVAVMAVITYLSRSIP